MRLESEVASYVRAHVRNVNSWQIGRSQMRFCPVKHVLKSPRLKASVSYFACDRRMEVLLRYVEEGCAKRAKEVPVLSPDSELIEPEIAA